MKYHTRLRREIKASRYTQASFADAIGVSAQTIWMWCSGRTVPSAKRQAVISSVLGCDMTAESKKSEKKPKSKVSPMSDGLEKRVKELEKSHQKLRTEFLKTRKAFRDLKIQMELYKEGME